MKSIVIVMVAGVFLTACKNEDKLEEKQIVSRPHIELSEISLITPETLHEGFNWAEVPELKGIGNFPFVRAEGGLEIKHEKEGLSELFDYATMQNASDKGIFSSAGKLGVLAFEGADNTDFNQQIFNSTVNAYFVKIGAKKLYQGSFPADDIERSKLEENNWSGKHGNYGFLHESEAPFTVYAFRNKGKKYVLNIQSNSAQGNVFIMELATL